MSFRFLNLFFFFVVVEFINPYFLNINKFRKIDTIDIFIFFFLNLEFDFKSRFKKNLYVFVDQLMVANHVDGILWLFVFNFD